jgi:hydrogenase expression/formation protein HypD
MEIRYLDEFRDSSLVGGIVSRIKGFPLSKPARIMEVCGTHTMAISRGGIRTLLGKEVELISGPGCPVCVTPDGYIDGAIRLGEKTDAIITTFGDMIKVPGKRGSLEEEKAAGLDLRVVYSPLDALKIAEESAGREVVFLGVGFETTAPPIAGALITAREKGIRNFSVLPSLRTIPEAMEALMVDDDVSIDAFLCPAHVSTIIGANAYTTISSRFEIPCVVAGFEYLDILLGIYYILEQIVRGEGKVENEYSRVAQMEGNRKALDVIYTLFEPCDISWRGIGVIPSSGLKIQEGYQDLDAGKKFGISLEVEESEGPCRCGDILKGKILPLECPLFQNRCTPYDPVGPCMVSSEGTCAAYYKYGGCLEEA